MTYGRKYCLQVPVKHSFKWLLGLHLSPATPVVYGGNLDHGIHTWAAFFVMSMLFDYCNIVLSASLSYST